MSHNLKRIWIVSADGVREMLADGASRQGFADVRAFDGDGNVTAYPAAAVCWSLPQVVRRCLEMKDRWDGLATLHARKQREGGPK